MPVTSSGTAANFKRVIGVDTGSGAPVFDSATWSRTSPGGGQDFIISISGNYWVFENLTLRSCRHAVKKSAAGTHVGLVFRKLEISNVRHGFWMRDADQVTIEDCAVRGYSKHAYLLEAGCDSVDFIGCVADLTNGDTTWWEHSEEFPFGFFVNDGVTGHTDITFTDCTAANNRMNNQGISYWNGDGFVVEATTNGVSFLRCIALNNEDGGYDIKAASTFTDCVSVRNYRGFRLWNVTQTMTNCVATYPFRRTTGAPNGYEGGTGIWVDDGTGLVDRFTGHAVNGIMTQVSGSGSIALTNSILSYTSSAGTFRDGTVTFGAGTVTYKPGTGTNPAYLAPSASWDGIGPEMNSATYGATKGYYFGPVSVRPEADTHVHDQFPTTNYGTSTTLLVKDGPATWARISYVRFPVSMTASTALLKLKVVAVGAETGTGARPIEIRQLASDAWSETGMTWNTRAAANGTLIATIANAGTVGVTHTIDVTSYVNAQEVADGLAGFALVQPAGASRLVYFGSRENAGNEPVLELQP